MGARSAAPLLRVILLAAPLLAAGCGRKPSGGAPNVLVILSDTHRADHVSPETPPDVPAGEAPLTPNLRRLGEQGVRFTAAYTPVPTSAPAYATLFTGLPPREHAVLYNAHALGAEHPVLAERFRAEGYATAAFVSNRYCGSRFGFARGFDEFWDDIATGREGRVVTDAALAWLDHRPEDRPFFLFLAYMDCHTPYLTDERGPNLRVLLNGEEVAEVRGENGPRPTVIPVRLPPGGSDVRLRYFGGGDGEMLPPSGRSPLHVGDLRVAPDDVELDAPPRLPGDDGKHFRTLANETVLRLRNPRDAPVDAEIRFQGFRAYSRKEQPAFYRDGVRAVDVEVGRLLRRLERAGLAGTTAVLFTADHGEMLGEHGAWGHRRAVYEEDVRVPLLIRGPGVPAGSEERRRVGLADLHRLLTALPRRGFQEWSEGLGPEGSPGRDFVATSYPPQAAWRRVALFRGTRKLILRPQGDPELYDLATDPREQANRWEELRKEPVASAMLRDAREEIERAMEATSVRRDSLSAETAERLQALGYVD